MDLLDNSMDKFLYYSLSKNIVKVSSNGIVIFIVASAIILLLEIHVNQIHLFQSLFPESFADGRNVGASSHSNNEVG